MVSKACNRDAEPCRDLFLACVCCGWLQPQMSAVQSCWHHLAETSSTTLVALHVCQCICCLWQLTACGRPDPLHKGTPGKVIDGHEFPTKLAPAQFRA